MADWFNESNEYIETVNLFNVTMGEAAPAAREFAKSVEAAMGIDSKDFMQYQGVFKNLTAGFGVAEEDANKMSQNLTQLSYDMASFFNTDVETAFDKLSSAMSGQVKGLREFGIDTTVATLQEYALANGIDKSVRSMTQAEKSLLRYNYIMEQSQHIQNDMARTIITPANSLRILESQLTRMRRAFGNIVSVLATKLIPYVQAFVEIITDAANALAKFFGFDASDFEADTDGIQKSWGSAEDGVDDYTDALKEAKKQMMGFDELNIISNPNSDGGAGDVAGGGSLDGMDLYEYDFLAGLDTSKLDEVKDKVKDILWYIGEIAVGLLAWELSKSFLGSLNGLVASLGLVLVIDSIREVITDGISWKTIIEGAIGGALLGAAIGFKLGGFPGALGGLIIGIGVSLVIQGITSMISEGANIENIVTLIGGALGTVAGIVTVIKMFNKTTPAPTPEIETATNTIEQTSTGTSTLTTKLKSFATNLAWGLVILAEVAAAAILIVAAIWIIGELLTQVVEAWKPVIENGGTAAIAIGVGVGILAGVGVASALLGKIGKGLATDIAIGAAMLVLIGAAAVVFVAEIWLIGEGLQKVLNAWQPVLNNGETVAAGIGLGTALLIGIGVVTAALGAATVGSAGLLPLAIGLGTALLVELAIAFQLFVDSIVDVAKKLNEDLAPELDELNGKLPNLSSNMSDFTDFMSDFVWEFVVFSANNTIAGIAATVEKIIGFFLSDPIQSMSDNVAKQNRQFDSLIRNLEDAIPDVERAIDLVEEYNDLMEEFEKVSDSSKPRIITFLSEVLTGVWNNIKKVINTILGGIELMVNGVIKGLNWMINSLNKLNFDVPDWVPIIGGETFGFNIRNISTISIPRLAEGGFVDKGQMFIAREAGPELVGSIGNKTAVANTDQIISGIESGVYRAVVAANANGGKGTQTIRIINEIDGDVVGEKVIQYHNGRVIQTGVSPLLV